MKIAICDDNAKDTAQICAMLNEHFDRNGYMGEFETFESGEALLSAFENHTYDAVFLDIYMKGMSGLETAEKLRKIDPEFALVFISSSSDHAMEAFSYRACSYVRKPIQRTEIDNAFFQCNNIFMKNARFIQVSSNGKMIKIPLAKIIYLEVYNKEILLHTSIGIIKTTTTLNAVEKSLNSAFLRCHRSYIVNMNHVTEFQTDYILMFGGEKVPMRQRGRSQLRDCYNRFISNRLFEVSL